MKPINKMNDTELTEFYEKRLLFVGDEKERNFINWALELMKKVKK
jgi:hypothetical protein